MSEGLSPIALFAYNRPRHLRETVDALRRNELADRSDLVVYFDGPKCPADADDVLAVRRFIRRIDGFKSVRVVERAENSGLARSIVEGVTETVNRYGRVIVLEDDLVSSPYFLRFMNEALSRYENEERVISIVAYVYPAAEKFPDTFFLKRTDSWGWGTWKRGWDLFESDGKKLLRELQRRKLTKEFDVNGAYRFTLMLKYQIAGKNDSWAIRWYASAFLRDRLSLYPGLSLIRHIGNDGSGTHFGTSEKFNSPLATGPVRTNHIEIEEHREAQRILEDYFRSVKTPIAKAALNRLKKHTARMITYPKPKKSNKSKKEEKALHSLVSKDK